MKIKRAVKSAAVADQMESALRIAKRADIKGIEIQEIIPLIEEVDFEKRGRIVADCCKNYSINHLAYHFPIKDRFDNIDFAYKFDLTHEAGSYALNLIEETIKEAGFAGNALKIEQEIPIIVHLMGFVERITLEEKERRMELGEKKLLEVKEMTDFYSAKYGVRMAVARENMPADHGNVLGILDFNPEDIIRTADAGIGNCLDLSHIWQIKEYYEKGRGEFPGIDLNKKSFPKVDIEAAVLLLKSSLNIIHLNDNGPGFTKENEGWEIGKGVFPHSSIIPLICRTADRDIIGTYEIKEGHKNPETMFLSDQHMRKIFGKRFNEYFE